jgi:hypothetical protein
MKAHSWTFWLENKNLRNKICILEWTNQCNSLLYISAYSHGKNEKAICILNQYSYFTCQWSKQILKQKKKNMNYELDKLRLFAQ